jgi:histone H3/H4
MTNQHYDNLPASVPLDSQIDDSNAIFSCPITQSGLLMTKVGLPLEAMRRLVMKGGVERVAHEASEELRIALENVAERIAKNATFLAHHAGRRTINARDIKLASKDVIHR